MKKRTTDAVTRLLNMGSGFVSVCAGLLATVLILYSGYVLYDSLATEVSAFSSSGDLLKYKPGVMAEAPEDTSLAEKIPDYRAWITVDGTPIDYPVVQGENDLYYATHDAYRKSSLTGAIYLAASNSPDLSDSYNVLYGHHMENGAMFGSLDKYRDKAWFSSHQKAVVTAKNGKVYDVTFFAVADTDAYEKQIYRTGNRAGKVISFLTGSRDNDAGLGTDVLIYDKKAAKDADKIIALSTCDGDETNGRLVVFGCMKEREKPKPTNTNHGGDPTPAPGKTVKLIVKYYEGDRKVFPDEVYIYAPGDEYYVVPPQYPGYEVSVRIVKGTIQQDMTVIVRFTPKTYRMTIRYIFPDGTEAAPAYEAPVRTGESYDVESPRIRGYRTLRLRIRGVNPGWDETFAVIYIPDDGTEYSGIDSFDTPLNPGYPDMQTGICSE